MPRTTHRTPTKMWCTIRNFLFRIVLGIVKAEICNKSGKAVLSDYVHPRRVPLKEDRLEQPRTDFRVQSVILLTNSGTMTSETPHSDLCIRKCACGTSCKWPLVLDWMLQSAQQCRYSMFGETNPKDDQDVSLSRELWAVVKGHGDWSLEIRILKAYCWSSLLWGVGALVGSRRSCLRRARDPRYIDTPKVWSAQSKVNKRLKFRLCLITHNIY